MNLYLKNICRLEEANIELNGITIIGGENSTGKSTVGKSLYCILNSFYQLNKIIIEERKRIVLKNISRSSKLMFNEYNLSNILDKLFEFKEEKVTKNTIKDIIYSIPKQLSLFSLEESVIDKDLIEIIFKSYKEVMLVSEEKIFLENLQLRVDNEFDEQINNIFELNEEGIIKLTSEEKEILIKVKNNKITKTSKNDLSNYAVYLDDYSILDDNMFSRIPLGMRIRNEYNHKVQLKLMLNRNVPKNPTEEIIKSEIIDEKIFYQVNDIFKNEKIDFSDLKYSRLYSNKNVSLSNTSSGLKTFILLKLLLLKECVTEDSFLILDEPEVHLHPKWQLILAETIVLLKKEYNINILLTTHSPYFLRSVEVFSAKHNLADKCKYYLSDCKNDKFIIEDVTNNTDKIYYKLAQPLEKLMQEFYNND